MLAPLTFFVCVDWMGFVLQIPLWAELAGGQESAQSGAEGKDRSLAPDGWLLRGPFRGPGKSLFCPLQVLSQDGAHSSPVGS